MKRYALLGQKLGHSYSSVIHNYSFKQISIDAVYEHIEIESEKFNRKLDNLKEGEFSGFNVTIPYKQAILAYVDELDTEAEVIGAVNTINIVNKSIGAFLRKDIRASNKNIELARKLVTQCEEINELALKQKGTIAISIGYIVESNRRIGEYAEDISETAINYLVWEKK